MKKDILKNHICTCKKDNKKLGKNVYSCFKCEKRKKLSWYDRYLAYASNVARHANAKGIRLKEKEVFNTWMKANIDNEVSKALSK